MSTRITELSEIGELEKLADLLATIWGRSGEPPVNTDTLRALAMSRNYVAAAFDGDQMIGGLVGWLGGTPAYDLHMHSHILGVLPECERKGVGFELKQHQRRWCLARGVRVMEWTTDPLVRRNVYFNLTKLGAEAPEYLVNTYGQMRDGINAGDESDRVVIRWRLDSERAAAASRGELNEPDVEKLRRGASSTMLSVGPRGEPVEGSFASRVLICQVPDDIVEVRHSDPALSRAWRLALRSAMMHAVAEGFAITGATRSGWYVLETGTS